MIHGTGEMLTEIGNESISGLIAYVGECKRQNVPIEPLGTFYNAAQTTVEHLALVGGNLSAGLQLEAPSGADLALGTRLKGSSQDIKTMLSSSTRSWAPVRRPGAPQLMYDLALRFAHEGRSRDLSKLIGSYPGLVNTSNRHGTSLLSIAGPSGWASTTATVLLENNANVNAAHDWKGSPLLLACDKNDETVVKMLISAGANVNLADAEGNTALHFACKKFLDHGSFRESPVEMLIKANADPTIRNKKGESPLSFARASKDGHAHKSADLVALLEGAANKPASKKARL
jgi:hypothetical protein